MRHTEQRHQEVLDAANRLIVDGGLANFSMLALARSLGMSKETLYAWFGSKSALLAELVQGNAGEMLRVIEQAAEAPLDAARLELALRDFCAALLTLLTSDRSVAINRGAVHLAEKGEMGEALRAHGRDAVLKRLAALLQQAQSAGLLASAGATEAEVLVALALRDWQLDRLLGRMAQPSARRVKARAEEAVALFLRLYGAS